MDHLYYGILVIGAVSFWCWVGWFLFARKPTKKKGQ